ncbi:SixA phosphatase family protein [Sphingomonas jatrophae]|uniref:Phosphohistidine phosphatase n=1 Tax=Sphingomonas jatrophae TaxID=1166337 RepID=A0A1I6M6Q9_9SPHN|nr:histidine phosphatase family protein [Sphingomonas jatrophae]SFS11182.1 phosphohistidine phosphatase [Sphingomonas jatrophae]
MKRLFLLRHAKSGWDDPVARDFDRPLNAKGKRAARAIGRYLRDEKLVFDRVTASPATRVVETLDEVAAGRGATLAPVWDKRLYLASASALLDIVQDAANDSDSLLLVGHNPGLEELVLLLVPDREDDMTRDEIEEKLPTASFVELRFDVASWDAVAENGGTLGRFVRPRDLDPALGPGQP